MFVPPPPPERPGTIYTAGERVAVEWGGHWWPATLLSEVGAHEWRVHFEGWDRQYDVVVGPSRIRHVSQVTRRTPGGVSPIVAGAMFAGVLVLGVAVFVALQPRAVPPAAPAPEAPAPAPAGTYAAGDPVQIEWKGSWYPGRIVEVAGARYKITYDGYSSSWDEWVEVSRLRRP